MGIFCRWQLVSASDETRYHQNRMLNYVKHQFWTLFHQKGTFPSNRHNQSEVRPFFYQVLKTLKFNAGKLTWIIIFLRKGPAIISIMFIDSAHSESLVCCYWYEDLWCWCIHPGATTEPNISGGSNQQPSWMWHHNGLLSNHIPYWIGCRGSPGKKGM